MKTKVAISFGLVAVLIGVFIFWNLRTSVPTNAQATLSQAVTEQKLDADPQCKGFRGDPCDSIIVSGTGTNFLLLTVVLVRQDYTGGTDYNTILKLSKILDTPPAIIQRVSIVAGSWSAEFRDYAGTYRVLVYDTNTHKLLTEGEIIVTD